MWKKALIIGMIATALLAPACARANGGATLYFGGPIYAKDATVPVDAVVVQDGWFTYVGNLDGALQAAGQDCARVDLQGHMMLPSFFEAHAHPDLGSLLDLRDMDYADDVQTPEAYVAYIREYFNAHPDTQALRGTGWDIAAFPDAHPSKALLDQVSTEIPIFIRSFDQHYAWVNSKALEMSGISQDTPDPVGGQIIRDASGEPCGTLLDQATILVDSALPPVTVKEHKELILKYRDMAYSQGFTGSMSAMVLPRDNQYLAYRELLAEGTLGMYTRLAFLMTPDTYQDAVQWVAKESAAYEAAGSSDLLGFRLAKFFMDGTIIGQSACLSEEYAARPGFKGEPQWAEDALQSAFRLCEENGLRVHVHAVGDAAVHLALNQIEAAGVTNKPAITHLELIEPKDFARFRDLGVIAVINPYWFCKSAAWPETELKQLGLVRSERMLPAKSFYDAGVTVAAASDYPVSSPNMLIGAEMAVTRTLIAPWRGGRTAEACALNPSEAISMEQALDAFTLSAAYAYDLDTITGSIEVGKSADFVLLDTSIWGKAPSQCQVLETWFQGKLVYRANEK